MNKTKATICSIIMFLLLSVIVVFLMWDSAPYMPLLNPKIDAPVTAFGLLCSTSVSYVVWRLTGVFYHWLQKDSEKEKEKKDEQN